MLQRSPLGLINEVEGFDYEATGVPLDGLGDAVSGRVEGCSDA